MRERASGFNAQIKQTDNGSSLLEIFVSEKIDFGNRDLQERIEGLVAMPENFLGQGGSARVYDLGDQCIKIMRNRHQAANASFYKLGNSTAQEYYIQNTLRDIIVDGVFVPKVFSFYEGKNSAAIVMERLDAANMQMILNGQEPIPANFTHETFFSSLEIFIDEMHALGIAHADLKPRNIMIDRASGNPRVIDFGKSKIIPCYEAERSSEDNNLIFSDIDLIDDARDIMNHLLTKTRNHG